MKSRAIWTGSLRAPAVAIIFTLCCCVIMLSPVFAAASGAKCGDVSLKVLYTNDIHSSLNCFTASLAGGATEEIGGMARIAAFAKAARAENPNTLLLSSGDSFQGTLFFNFFRGAAEFKTAAAAGYNVMCPGNHEFDEGAARLIQLLKFKPFDFVNCNLEFDAALYPAAKCKIKPYVIKNVGGVRVALIGVITKNLANVVDKKHMRGITVLDPLDAVGRIMPEVKKNSDIVILLSHMGYEADIEMAPKLRGVDFIIGGHSHTKLDAPVIIEGADKRPIAVCQAFEKGEFVGELNIIFKPCDKSFELTGAKLLRMDKSVPKDGGVQAIVDKYAGEIAAEVMVEVGTAVKPLVGERDLVRSVETNLGDFLADMLLQQSKADMAVVNGGSIRSSIAKGGIKVADCINAFPFNQCMSVLKIKGKYIKKAFDYVAHQTVPAAAPPARPLGLKGFRQSETVLDENGYFTEIIYAGSDHSYNKAGKYGGFLQVSKGVCVSYENGAVKSLLLYGQPIEDEKIYTVATSEFTAGGGDGLNMFCQAEENSLSGNMTALFVEAVKALKIIDVDTDGRIK